jgi:hypothetical protein
MKDGNEMHSAPKVVNQVSSEPKSRVAPSGAEIGYTLLALCSFAAALYALWLAGISAALTGPNTALSAAAPVAWAPVVLAGLAAAALIWACFHMLSKSSVLATRRGLLALIQALAIPDTIKLQAILSAAGAEFCQPAPSFAAEVNNSGAERQAAAGQWVLERFGEGSAVVAIPENLATSERLRAVVGDVQDQPIQVLRNNLPNHTTEDVA